MIMAVADALCLHCQYAPGPDFSDFLTGSDIKDKYSVEAPNWKVCALCCVRVRACVFVMCIIQCARVWQRALVCREVEQERGHVSETELTGKERERERGGVRRGECTHVHLQQDHADTHHLPIPAALACSGEEA